MVSAPPPAGHAVWVNATPIGMYAAGTLPCAPRRGDVCVDWAYAAGGTEFLRAATAAEASDEAPRTAITVNTPILNVRFIIYLLSFNLAVYVAAREKLVKKYLASPERFVV